MSPDNRGLTVLSLLTSESLVNFGEKKVRQMFKSRKSSKFESGSCKLRNHAVLPIYSIIIIVIIINVIIIIVHNI